MTIRLSFLVYFFEIPLSFDVEIIHFFIIISWGGSPGELSEELVT